MSDQSLNVPVLGVIGEALMEKKISDLDNIIREQNNKIDGLKYTIDDYKSVIAGETERNGELRRENVELNTMVHQCRQELNAYHSTRVDMYFKFIELPLHGKKINRIKEVRYLAQCGLKEAKDFVELNGEDDEFIIQCTPFKMISMIERSEASTYVEYSHFERAQAVLVVV